MGQRGLEPGTDLQTFIVALPAGFRDKFDAIREPLNNPNMPATRLQGIEDRDGRKWLKFYEVTIKKRVQKLP